MRRLLLATAVLVASLACAGAGPPPPALLPGEVWVTVPSRVVQPGEALATENLVQIRTQSDYVVDAVLREPAQLAGRKARERLLPAEFIRPERVSDPTGLGFVAPGHELRPDADPGGRKVLVIVAARDLVVGATIAEEDLYAVEVPAAYVRQSWFLAPEHVVGRKPGERILVNEFVRAERLEPPP